MTVRLPDHHIGVDRGQVFEFKRIGRELSNWGRWGADDQIGTVNFITPAARAAAGRLIVSGEVVPLGIPFSAAGPQRQGANQRFNPIHRMITLPSDGASRTGQVISDDMVIMPLQAATQWDSLAHVGYDGLFYNGVPINAVNALNGASRNAITGVIELLIGRAVLLDVAGLRGQRSLEAGEEVTADDLAAAARRQMVELRAGDIVLVRTGWSQRLASGADSGYLGPRVPGLGVSCCRWLHANQVAAVATDTPFLEVRPSVEIGGDLPVHMILIRDVGMTLGEMFDLERLADSCVRLRRWEFFFSGVGLAVSGAVGTPLSPVAVL